MGQMASGLAHELSQPLTAITQNYDAAQSGCLVLDYGLPEMNGLELQSLMNDR